MTDQDKPRADFQSEEALQDTDKTDANRRAVLAKIALLTPPAMVTLLLSTRPSAASVGGAPADPV